jgi:hypothetical protein
MSIIGLLSSLVRGETRRTSSSRRRRAACRRSLRIEALETRRLFNVDSTTLACEPVDDGATLAEPVAEVIASVTEEEPLVCKPAEPATAQSTTADLGTQESLVDDSTIDAIVETDLTLTSVGEKTATDTSLDLTISDTSLSGPTVTNLFGWSFPAPVLSDITITAYEFNTWVIAGRVQHTFLQSVTVVLGGVWEDSTFVRADGTFSFYKSLPAGTTQAKITVEALAMGKSSGVWEGWI